jgi:predicted restriction endonuclease
LTNSLVILKKKSIIDKLQEANRKMKKMSPAEINKIVEATITVRKDTPLIKALKNAANYKCQFNGCTAQIKMESGKYYVEVAHIKAVKDGGTSILGNLLVLCPNHHKEFDCGKRDMEIQKINRLVGKLNGVPFDINITS